jgi:hypothetical protein
MFNKKISYTPLLARKDSSFVDGLDSRSQTSCVVLMCGYVDAWGSTYSCVVHYGGRVYCIMCCKSRSQFSSKSANWDLHKFETTNLNDERQQRLYFIYASNSMTITSKSKHIHVKLHFVRDAIRGKFFVMQWCSTRNRIPNILAKFS